MPRRIRRSLLHDPVEVQRHAARSPPVDLEISPRSTPRAPHLKSVDANRSRSITGHARNPPSTALAPDPVPAANTRFGNRDSSERMRQQSAPCAPSCRPQLRRPQPLCPLAIGRIRSVLAGRFEQSRRVGARVTDGRMTDHFGSLPSRRLCAQAPRPQDAALLADSSGHSGWGRRSWRRATTGRAARIVVACVSELSYYQSEWLRRGLDPARVQSMEDFLRWPVIDRETNSRQPI